MLPTWYIVFLAVLLVAVAVAAVFGIWVGYKNHQEAKQPRANAQQ